MNADCDGQAGIQELAGNATMLFYMSEEGQEGRNAYLEKRKPDFSKFTREPWNPSNISGFCFWQFAQKRFLLPNHQKLRCSSKSNQQSFKKQEKISHNSLQNISTISYIQGRHGKFEPGKAQYSTPIFFDQLFLIRAYWNPKYTQGPIFYPNFFWPVVSYKSILKPKI